MKHFTIPIFIPQLGCPFQCIFCDQEKITSRGHVPDSEEVHNIISQYHCSFPKGKKHVEVGFFGGNFTGLSLAEQEKYLQVVFPYLQDGTIQGIRLSTRPDYIDEDRLSMLKKYGVTTIELGAQSLDEEVLCKAARGHTAGDVEMASRLIRMHGFRLGLQMMIGLPGDSLEKTLYTTDRIISLGARETRIYPVLVIKDTKLEEWYREGKYLPLSLEEAVFWLKTIIPLFEAAHVEVTRVGLHSSIGLQTGKELVAGPYHPSIRELAMTEVWWDRLMKFISEQKGDRITITVHPSQYNIAIGYYGKNRKRLLNYYRSVNFTEDNFLNESEFRVDHH